MRRYVTVAPALIAALLLGVLITGSGCSGVSGSSDEDAVREVIESLATAVVDGDGEAACGRMTASAATRLVDTLNLAVVQGGPAADFTDCSQVVSAILQGQRDSAAIKEMEAAIGDERFLHSVAVDEAMATATVGDGSIEVELERVDEEWYVSKPGTLLFGVPSPADRVDWED